MLLLLLLLLRIPSKSSPIPALPSIWLAPSHGLIDPVPRPNRCHKVARIAQLVAPTASRHGCSSAAHFLLRTDPSSGSWGKGHDWCCRVHCAPRWLAPGLLVFGDCRGLASLDNAAQPCGPRLTYTRLMGVRSDAFRSTLGLLGEECRTPGGPTRSYPQVYITAPFPRPENGIHHALGLSKHRQLQDWSVS